MTQQKRRVMVCALSMVVGAALLAGCTASQTFSTRAIAGTTTASSAPTTTPAPLARAVVSSIPPVGSTAVEPGAPVLIGAVDGALTTVTVTDADGVAVAGSLSADGAQWQATAKLGYASTYTLLAVATNAAGVATTLAGTLTTVTPRTLTYPSMLPNPDYPVVGVGQPIAVTFDEDITDKAAAETHMTVTTTPPVLGAWSWYSDREARYRPQAYWPAGTHVAVDINEYGVNVGADIYGQEDRHVEFDIGDSMIAQVDDAELQMRVYQNGALIRTIPTAMGKDATPTQNGVHVVQEQYASKIMDSSTFGLPIDDPDGYRTEVEWASRISGSGEFVHAAPWSVSDQGVRDVSHGCLNVSPDDAEWFYQNFGRGDVVEITGTLGPLLPKDDGFGDWNVPWDQWVAGSALT